ncbi:DNA polymerase III subunit beta [Buchnera aphidicola (Mindarus keteleerifoliae)]|uniref:DNA polymerase III subunit beta n=1 Tax=Buchnera aphidicola TaxID=9 RepID=UPI0031B675FC
MKFSINQKNLIIPLQKINGILTKNMSFPIISNILISINEKNILSLTATNLEIEITIKINKVKIFKKGEILISGKKILNICRKISKETLITFSLFKEKMYIVTNDCSFILSTASTKNFPKILSFKCTSKILISKKIFKKMLLHIYFSMGNQDIRYYLNGILLKVNEKVIETIATDGYRMAIASSFIIEKLPESINFSKIIPRKGIIELIRLLNDIESNLKIFIGKKNILMKLEDTIFITKTVEGDFPNYKNVLFKKNKNKVKVNVFSLKEALSRVSILSHEKLYNVTLYISAGKIKLTTSNQEDESAKTEINTDYQSDNIKISININFLLDILNVIQKKYIFLLFANPVTNLQIKEKDEFSIHYIIMPLRL